MNTLYTKDGKIKKRNQIVIKSQKTIKDRNGNDKVVDTQIFNPTEDLVLANGWQIYTTPIPSQEELLLQEKETKINEILAYDSSSEVNIFYMNDQPLWLDKSTRVGLKLRFDAEMASEQTTTTLWYNGQSFSLPLHTALQMLNAVELYASACYDTTQMHIANVKTVETIEEVKTYNYKVNYPNKLKF